MTSIVLVIHAAERYLDAQREWESGEDPRAEKLKVAYAELRELLDA